MLQIHCRARVSRIFGVLCTLVLTAGCGVQTPAPATPSASTNEAISLDESQFVGNWKVTSKQFIDDRDYVITENAYHFESDGTFNNRSTTKMVNNDSDEILTKIISEESGIWKVDGDQIQWETPNAEIIDFESSPEGIPRAVIEEGLNSDTPPECFIVQSVGENMVVLQPASGGPTVALTRTE